MASSPTTRNLPRLNPFAFPSDTTFRFVLLMVTVAATTVMLDLAIFNRLPWTWDYSQQLQQTCSAESLRLHPGDSAPAQFARSTANAICKRPLDHVQMAWLSAGLVLLAAATFGLYRAYPKRRIKRERLVSLTRQDSPEVVASLTRLVQIAALDRAPDFLWNPLKPTLVGLAFGSGRKSYVQLSGGLVGQFYADRSSFEAVVLHELAHLKNADIDKTYLTVAVWHAFVGTVLLPWVVVQLVTHPAGILTTLSARVAAVAALVLLTRNAVLRARELYADARAASWAGSSQGLLRVLGCLHEPPGRWSALSWTHPSPAQRRRALADTSEFFRFGFWVAIATGMAAALAFDSLHVFWELLLPDNYALFVTGALLGVLMAGVVGLGVWRAAFARVQGAVPRLRVASLSAALGLGCLIGKKMSLPDYAYSQSDLVLKGLKMVAFQVGWALLLAAGVLVIMSWLHDSARIWLRHTRGKGSVLALSLVGVGLAASFFGGWLALLFFLQNLCIGTESFFDREFIQSAVKFPLPPGPALYGAIAYTALYWFAQTGVTQLLLGAFVAFPLLGWLWRSPVAHSGASQWAYLDSTCEPAAPLPPRRRRVLIAGLACGIVGGLALPYVGDQSPMLLGPVAPLFACVAAALAAPGRTGGWLHGVFAATLVAGVEALAILAHLSGGYFPALPSFITMLVASAVGLSIPVALVFGQWRKHAGPTPGRRIPGLVA